MCGIGRQGDTETQTLAKHCLIAPHLRWGVTRHKLAKLSKCFLEGLIDTGVQSRECAPAMWCHLPSVVAKPDLWSARLPSSSITEMPLPSQSGTSH